jgi:hypothetical protein
MSGTLTTEITDHFSNFVIVKESIYRHTHPTTISYRRINDHTLKNFNNALLQANWNDVLSTMDSSLAYDKFLKVYNNLKDEHLPIITCRFNKYKHKSQPWITKGLLISLRTKDKLYSKYLKSNNTNCAHSKNMYITYSRIFKKTIRLAKITYWKNRFKDTKHDMKATWKNVNHILNKSKNKKDLPDIITKRLQIIMI